MVDLLPQLLDGRRRCPRPEADPELGRVVQELERDGVSVLEGAATTALVAAAVADLDRFIERMPALQGTWRTKPRSTGGIIDYRVHEFQRDLNIYRSHDPLMFSPTYAQFLLLPALTAIAESYLGRGWLYQAMIATRTESSAPTREGFAQWHHDARGRKLNALLLLTDVPANGPATIVLAGSHHLLYSRARRVHNFFSDEEVELLQQRFGWRERVCHGRAGSLIFFDSQALHLGRRSPHRRNVFQVNCMNKRGHLWPQQIPASLISTLAERDRRTLLERADLEVVGEVLSVH
ncbi:phytanoyl-CoA dioxygenase family protein [Synechococcus sp. GFB01]|uniref:phytanoyl-CoA dioxygenase family protein n=1 Tax=Synechococcus sp. GFB01 TaxID=1662190 RepID=UPI001F341C78|nr:phytanoyl-CoA dioxygenase family protein [Synechococcus sp. GFB01]